MNLKGLWVLILPLISAATLRADVEQICPEPTSSSQPAAHVRECGLRGPDDVRIASLWGQTPPVASPKQTPHPSVVRVIAVDRNSMSLGSGTLIDANDQYGLVITCWHVVRDAVGPIEVVFPDGFHSLAQVVRTDREWDLAALLIWKPTVQPVPISITTPRPGDPLTIAGYGSGNYLMQSGRCEEYLSPAPGRPLEIVELSAAARHGDSGGPILNSRGELAGVLFGEGGGHTDGSYCGRVQKFLQLAAVDLRRLPQTNIAANGRPLNTGQVAQNKPGARFEGGVALASEGTAASGSSSSSSWTETPSPRVADRAAGNNARPDQNSRPLAMAAPNDASTAPNGTTNRQNPWSGWKNEGKTLLAAFGVAAIILQLVGGPTKKKRKN